MEWLAIDNVAEIFSLISLAVLSVVPVFFYLRGRLSRLFKRLGQESEQRPEPEPEPSAPAVPAEKPLQGIAEHPAPPRPEAATRRELRMFEQATVIRRERARQEGEARARGFREGRRIGWTRIAALPPLKRALVLSEVLGPPRALSDSEPSPRA